jgi:hypothetical protein
MEVALNQWLLNTIIKDGIIDGFKAPNKIFTYNAPQDSLEWINECGASCYFTNVLIVHPADFGETLNRIHASLLENMDEIQEPQATGDDDIESVALMVWESPEAYMIAIVSMLDGTSHYFDELSDFKYLVLDDSNDNNPETAIETIENNFWDDAHLSDTTKEWLIASVNKFMED